jgi:hypothetical protein
MNNSTTLSLENNDAFKAEAYPEIRDKLNEILGDGHLDAEDDTLLDYVTLLVSNKVSAVSLYSIRSSMNTALGRVVSLHLTSFPVP